VLLRYVNSVHSMKKNKSKAKHNNRRKSSTLKLQRRIPEKRCGTPSKTRARRIGTTKGMKFEIMRCLEAVHNCSGTSFWDCKERLSHLDNLLSGWFSSQVPKNIKQYHYIDSEPIKIWCLPNYWAKGESLWMFFEDLTFRLAWGNTGLWKTNQTGYQ